GHVSMMFDVVSLALPSIKAGSVRALGVASKQRVAVLPDLPTLAEQGMPAEVGAWFGVLAPADTPPAAIAWINREATKVFSAADGYTILFGSDSIIAINPHLYPKLGYDPFKSFTPIALLAVNQLYLAVNPSLPVHTFAEFLAYARKSDPPLPYASIGNGSQHH